MRRLAACLVTALIGGSPHEPVELRFQPAQGAILSKTFAVETRGQIDALTWNGSDLSSMFAGLGMLVEVSLEVTDEVLELGDGRPLELLRDYDGLRTIWDWADRSEVLHPLLYRTVRFTWDEDERAYETEWDSRRSLGSVPEGVGEDLDLRSLLPGDPVEIGETWYLPLAAIGPVLLPGGAIHREPTLWHAWGLFELEEAISPQAGAWFSGDVLACTLEEVTTRDERRVAVVSLDLDWWTILDMRPAYELDGWWSRLAIDRSDLEFEMEGQGELVWDLDGGHFLAFELEAELDVDLDLRSTWGDIDIRATGRGRWTAQAAAE